MKTISISLIFILIIVSSIALADETGHGQNSQNNLSIQSIIVPLGILTLILLISTLTLGFSLPKNRKRLFPWHRKLAIVTIIVAIVHATFVLIFH